MLIYSHSYSNTQVNQSESVSSVIAAREGIGFRSLILLFPIDFHFEAAGAGSQFAVSGPSIDILMRLSSVILVNHRLRIGVLIRFIAENTHSTSADDAGSTQIRASNSEMMVYAAAMVT